MTVTGNRTLFEKCDSIWSKATTNLEDVTEIKKPQRVLLAILQTTAKIAGFVLVAAQHAKLWLDIIKDFSGHNQYAYQYNGKVFYNNQKCVKKGNKRRNVLRQPFYLDNGFHSVGEYNVNNGGRNSSIFVELKME